jgi:hypothetical protein
VTSEIIHQPRGILPPTLKEGIMKKESKSAKGKSVAKEFMREDRKADAKLLKKVEKKVGKKGCK